MGRGELPLFMISGISVQPSTTASAMFPGLDRLAEHVRRANARGTRVAVTFEKTTYQEPPARFQTTARASAPHPGRRRCTDSGG